MKWVGDENQRKMMRVEGRAYQELSPSYYGICTVGGMLSAGTIHLAITPLDVLKVNMQVCYVPKLLWGFSKMYCFWVFLIL